MTWATVFLMMILVAGCGQATADVPEAAKNTFQAYVELELKGWDELQASMGKYLTGPALSMAPHYAISKGQLEKPIEYTLLDKRPPFIVMSASVEYAVDDEYLGHRTYQSLAEVTMVEAAPNTWKIYSLRHIISGQAQQEEETTP
ncbi:MAG: hypothetical protein KM310_00015 [Clostridiales bacterium]|nr:hypothetical protein [Clostridiales bacterium]